MTAYTTVSFEVYPPRSPDKISELHESILALDTAAPEFISVTFGAGGASTRDSLDVLRFIKGNTQARPLAHLTCVGTTQTEAKDLVTRFLDQGISEFLALRGDLPQGETEHQGELHHAVDLVSLMRNDSEHSKAIDRIAVATFPNGHPESHSLDEDIDTLLAKQSAGATLAITQLFFFAEEYLGFVDKATRAGVSIPIIPGLMPITSPGRLTRVLELTGEEEPRELSHQLRSTTNPEEWKSLGIEWCARMIRELVDAGVPGIHLYAFNRHETVLSALAQAGVR